MIPTATIRIWMILMLLWIGTTCTAQMTFDSIQHSTSAATRRPFQMAAKTNLLYDAALIPTVGVEVPFGQRWTVGADWFWTWIYSYSHHDYWQAYGGYLTVRRYFKPFNSHPSTADCPFTRFTGHHLGLYILGMTYDVERRHRGYQATRFGFGGGVEYGYSMRAGRRVNIDFSLGVGFQDGEYKEYDPIDDHYVWQATRKRHWWGPTKAEVTVVWFMDMGRKGGAR